MIDGAPLVRGRRRGARRRRCIAAALLPLGLAIGAPSGAQQVERRGVSPRNLPRPGYEPHVTRIGNATARVEVDISALDDSNVFATSRKPVNDVIVVTRPRANLDWSSNAATLHGEAYAAVFKHVDVTQEDMASFGGALAGALRVSRQQTITSSLRFDRVRESRTDPESRRNLNQPPRKIDALAGEVGYAVKGANVALALAGGYQSYNYLDPLESDRNMRLYRGSATFELRPNAPLSFFFQGYVARRDFVRAVDFSGVDRDATTIGALLGLSHGGSGLVQGKIGVGIFRFQPDAPGLPAFTGLAVDGQLTWSPRPRTAVVLTVFRGDVATVRVGATNRIDTDVALRLEQEVRHNLLLEAQLSFSDILYRGPSQRSLTTYAARIEGEYLFSGTMSAFAAGTFTRRDGRLITDRFTRPMVELGLRFRF
ncbi:hypothetical protein SAMN03159338_0640 [Sphingomonas sp. NFR04]|uniref:outer membrane beta-barrel protein n=1 Tax=Sphingomonas sp. NFR04 TaxID=1566283 RepID=UPI0008E86204|nr:outer membrane beta-barrel protein [Sphingomonas sp. NFR04]SFJ03979.1 hypothetical protein SAMN03159338_0640 [Sphingomonas sp. NFR04]